MKRLFFFSLLLVFSLVLSAVTPGLVYAEGDIPEEPAPEPPVVEETPPEDTGSAVEQLAESGAVIADPGGDLVPLASQAALDVVCDPDPWFYCSVGCVGGKSPVYGTFAEAISNWAAKKGYGYLYIQGSAVPYVTNFSLNGTPATPSNPFNTLTGIVWDKTGLKPVLNGIIELWGFTKGFTLQGLTITANSGNPAIYFHNTTGTIKLVDVSVSNTGGSGIRIYNKGPVIITNVNANDNKQDGLFVDNVYNDGIKYVSTGNVTITNSAFLRNGVSSTSEYSGLQINSSGSILLNGVTAYGNAGNGGSFLVDGNLLLIRNSVFSGTIDTWALAGWGFGVYTHAPANSLAAITFDNVILNGNEADGAYLQTGGNITLNRVYAANNGQHGVYISGDYNVDSVGAKNVTVSNSTFTSNSDTNLEIHASGAVKVTNLYSTKSVSGRGLYVNNHTYNSIPVPVTILGAFLIGNAQDGAFIGSDGTITVAGITALENGWDGMYLDNWWSSGSTGNIIVSSSLGLNRFNGNTGGRGLYSGSYGNLSLASIQANGNGTGGIVVNGYGSISNVALVNVEASGNLGAIYYGVGVVANGAVTLNKVTASDNKGQGISVDNTNAQYSRPVTILSSAANGNGKVGIYVKSAGAITLSGVTASGNSLTGADLLNSVLTKSTQVPQGITVLKSTFDLNGYSGLSIDTMRKITLTSINASENNYRGVWADNSASAVASAIVVSGTNRINHNGRSGPYHGIALNSTGPVTVSGITAAWNPVDGVYVYTASSVTASNIQVIGNSYNGAEFYGNGLMTLTGITALQNGTNLNYSGVYVNNSTGKVRVNSGLILGNGAYGLWINVANTVTDAYVAPGVVVFGNDVKDPYEGFQIYIN